MFDYLGVSLLLGLALLFGWLTWRAWRVTRPALRWGGVVLSGLLTLVLATALGAALVGYVRLNRQYDNPVPQVSVEATPERIARGEHLAKMCAGCHAADEEPPMEGRDFLAEGAPPVGQLYAPNLTPVHLGEWSDGEILRAVREGIHRSGRSLIIMPSRAFRNLSDDDLLAIIAYLRSQPPVEPDTPPKRLNVLGAIMSNIAPIFEAQAPVTAPVIAPPEGVTPEYGKYVSSYTCALCHGAGLGGDEEFGSPSLSGAGHTWREDEFLRFMHSGERPDGSSVDPEAMPWELLSELLENDELRAIFAYMGTLDG